MSQPPIYIMDVKKRSSQEFTSSPCHCDAQLATTCLFTPTFSASDFDLKVGQTDLVWVCDHGSLVGLWVQNYKLLCAAVTICAP